MRCSAAIMVGPPSTPVDRSRADRYGWPGVPQGASPGASGSVSGRLVGAGPPTALHRACDPVPVRPGPDRNRSNTKARDVGAVAGLPSEGATTGHCPEPGRAVGGFLPPFYPFRGTRSESLSAKQSRLARGHRQRRERPAGRGVIWFGRSDHKSIPGFAVHRWTIRLGEVECGRRDEHTPEPQKCAVASKLGPGVKRLERLPGDRLRLLAGNPALGHPDLITTDAQGRPARSGRRGRLRGSSRHEHPHHERRKQHGHRYPPERHASV